MGGFIDLVGADISCKMLAKAEKKGCYSELHKADLSQSLPFDVASFDGLLCVGTTTYLNPSSLRDWLRVLKPGGKLVMTNKTAGWPLWEPVQATLLQEGLMEIVWLSEPMHYLPSLQVDFK